MNVTLPQPVADVVADAEPRLPGEAGRTESGVPLGRIPSKGGLLVWNGREVEELHVYPVDSRWMAWQNRDQRGGWWFAWHDFAMGEHMFRCNAGPFPRVMVEEILEQRANLIPEKVEADPAARDRAAASAGRGHARRGVAQAALMTEDDARERCAEDQADGFGSDTPVLEPGRWD